MVKNNFLCLKWFLQLLFKALTCIFPALSSKQVMSRIGISSNQLILSFVLTSFFLVTTKLKIVFLISKCRLLLPFWKAYRKMAWFF